ncbi:MAG: DUF1207 domain-containing protein [Anaerolineae bacterium]
MMKYSSFACALVSSCLICFSASADQLLQKKAADKGSSIKKKPSSRSDNLPAENFEHANDTYLEGYIQALVDANYYEYQVLVSVKDHHVFLANLPKNQLLANSIISFVKDLPGVASVQVKRELSQTELAERAQYVEQPRVNGVWFPQSTVLFPPLVADPREPTYSVAPRFGDKRMGNKAIAVSLGDDFPIFRWRDIFRWHGDLQIGISAGVWAIFNFSHVPRRQGDGYCELVNTDYFVGVPLTYAFDRWAFRLRGYHISGHLGDEFIVNRPRYVKHHRRKNPSFEAIDFFTSYQFSSNLRVYFGPGAVCHSDKTFLLKPLYVQYGVEVRLFGHKHHYHRLYGTPFFAIHLENWQEHRWDLDSFFKLGYELSKLQGVGRKMRLYVDYHTGFSYEGQFFKKRTQYGEVGFSWGF